MQSDLDYIVVIDSSEDIYYRVDNEKVNITVYSDSLFIKYIKEHKVDVLECIFQNDKDPYVKYFKLNKENLRRSFSSVSSNSYVKCKKKIAQNDDFQGKKSLFHSFRILYFGIQIAEYNRIIDYSSCNHLYKKIMEFETWEDLENEFKPLHNRVKTFFRLVAPLDSEAID